MKKRLPFKTLLILIMLTVFSMTSFSPAYAESESKWYNPMSWWYGQSESTKEHVKKETRKAEKPAQKSHKKSSKKSAEQKLRVSSETGALIETQKGNITIRFYEKEAPGTVRNFTDLVEGKFYNAPGMKFHRVVPGFVIQSGDPTGTGYGGSGHKIPLEVKNKLSHDGKGVVAMARGPQPDSATSQFYITLKKHTQLDGKYAVFGQVIQGLDVLEKIKKDDRLYGIRLINISKALSEKEQRPEDKNLFNRIFGNLK